MSADVSRPNSLRPNAPERALVSIGLPIYNGERYVRQALDSILGQTYQQFELIISDNASTDGTERICRLYAANDTRIRYHRQAKNRGPTWNFREVVRLCSGKYFLWASHDDLLAPAYVERCVAILERNPNVVLCYSDPINIDEAGNQFVPGCSLKADLPRAHQRFRELIDLNHSCVALFGIIRSDMLKSTSIHGDFSDGDRCVLVELALRGDYYRIPEHLFFHREHADRFTRKHPGRQEQTRRANPGQLIRFVFPHFRILKEYTVAFVHAPLTWTDRLWCSFHLLNWVRWYRSALWSDIKFALGELVHSTPQVRQSAQPGADPLVR